MKAQVTISRNSRDEITLRVKDESSRVLVCEVTLTLEDYALLITGMSEIPGKVSYGELDFVGKKKVIEQRKIIYHTDNKEEIRGYLIELHLNDDWIPDLALNTQNSIVYNRHGYLSKDGTYTVNYSVHKFV